MKRLWKPVPGYEGLYEVSSAGVVRSVPREVLRRYANGRTSVIRRAACVLKQYTNEDGYRSVRFSRDGKSKTFLVARVVLCAFLGEPAEGLEAAHKNHDRADNRLVNLEWATRLENEQQKDAAGRRPTVPWAKLDRDAAAQIRSLRGTGKTYKSIAAQFGCTLSNVARVCAGGFGDE